MVIAPDGKSFYNLLHFFTGEIIVHAIEQIDISNHEQVIFCNDKTSGLKAIIAIHDTRLGAALGGCRMYPYANETEALRDVLRLSRGMTYKCAVTGMNFGGGKAVIIGDPAHLASELLFRAFGRFVQTLNGRYITAEDVGTDIKKMELIRIETKHVVGLPTYLGGLGDPSPATAYGTFVGIKASLKHMSGNENLTKVKVAVQGAGGHVGYHLCKNLHQAGAKLVVADVNAKALQKVANDFTVTVVKPDEIYNQGVDVFAPCAMGAILNDHTIPQLKCSIVAGSANNQLEDESKHGQALNGRSILYAPDYVINAGGLINVAAEFFRVKQSDYIQAKTEEIYETLTNVYQLAATKNTSTVAISQHIAEERLHMVSRCKQIYAKRPKSQS